MPSSHEQISQLEAAITAQESVRALLGDATVDSVIATLRERIQALRAPQGFAAGELLAGAPASAELLTRCSHSRQRSNSDFRSGETLR